MPTYISLLNWTDEGIRGLRATVQRAEAGADLAETMGGSVKDIYWTVGPYDLVVAAEFPDDETASAFALALASRGNVRTTTLRAYGKEEMSRIVERIG